MSENSKKWKSRLLSSSIPLEFEVAKVLSNQKFIVSYDYSYIRKDGPGHKEFSTDINATLYHTLESKKPIDATVTVLGECKYREEGKKWLFVPDVNDPDVSRFTLGNTIRVLNEFSINRHKDEALYKFEENCEFSLKGLEVNTISGDVFDKDVRHGVHQLKFALPYLIKEFIEFNLYGHIDDAATRFIVPVLITNAELYLINPCFSISQLKKVEAIEEISKKVPYLILYSDIGPDFTEHHKTVFKGFFEENRDSEILNKLEVKQKKFKYGRFKRYDSPIESCYEYQESLRTKLLENYSQFFVCSFEYFPAFIESIIQTVSDSLKR